MNTKKKEIHYRIESYSNIGCLCGGGYWQGKPCYSGDLLATTKNWKKVICEECLELRPKQEIVEEAYDKTRFYDADAVSDTIPFAVERAYDEGYESGRTVAKDTINEAHRLARRDALDTLKRGKGKTVEAIVWLDAHDEGYETGRKAMAKELKKEIKKKMKTVTVIKKRALSKSPTTHFAEYISGKHHGLQWILTKLGEDKDAG